LQSIQKMISLNTELSEQAYFLDISQQAYFQILDFLLQET